MYISVCPTNPQRAIAQEHLQALVIHSLQLRGGQHERKANKTLASKESESVAANNDLETDKKAETDKKTESVKQAESDAAMENDKKASLEATSQEKSKGETEKNATMFTQEQSQGDKQEKYEEGGEQEHSAGEGAKLATPAQEIQNQDETTGQHS